MTLRRFREYRDLKMAEVVRYDPDLYCDVTSIPKWDVHKKWLSSRLNGSFIDRRQNPYQPYTSKEIFNEAIALH